MSASDIVATEQTGFQLERFQWSGPDRLEVEGRWFGVRGRRFIRPVLTVQFEGRRRRLLAMLEHKPWQADENESWIAAFPWDGPTDGVSKAELEVGALTVDLPPPGGSRRGRRRPEPAKVPPAAAAAAKAPPAEAPAPAKVTPAAFEAPRAEMDVRPAASRRPAFERHQQLERELAGARFELGRLRQRHDEKSQQLRAAAHQAAERLEAQAAEAVDAAGRAEQASAEASHLREALRREREGQGAELERLRAADAEARAEAGRQREAAATTAAEAERLREAHAEAVAENQRLRQASRQASAEAERLRAAASRRSEARRPPDPQATAPFQAVPDDDTTARMPPPAERRTTAIRGHPEPAAVAAHPLGEASGDRTALQVWAPRIAALVLVALLLLALALTVSGIL